jgi:hypothetical protein
MIDIGARHIMTTISLSLCMAIASLNAQMTAEEGATATIRIKTGDSKISETARNLEKINAAVYRLSIPAAEITNGIDTIDVLLDTARASKGEDGYFVVSTGLLGTFRHDTGKIEERRNPMPIFGMKNPRGTFVGIVTGLKYEFGGRPTFYFNPYKDFNPNKEAYDEYQPLKHLQYEFMDFHDEIAKDVFLTRYGNGREIVTNYTDTDYLYRGRTVKAKDYTFIAN